MQTARVPVLTTPCPARVCDTLQGLSANVVERLSECHLNCKRLTVHVAQGVEDSEEPAALRATLTQLCDGLHTTGDVTLCLSGWEWDARLLQRYVQAMPALAERGVVRHHFRRWGPLTDELLGIVLEVRDKRTHALLQKVRAPVRASRIGYPFVQHTALLPDSWLTRAHTHAHTRARERERSSTFVFMAHAQASAQITGLCVSSLALQSDTHANTPWPWDELSISSFDITDLCKLPDPAGERVPREVSCREVILSERMLQVRVPSHHQGISACTQIQPSKHTRVLHRTTCACYTGPRDRCRNHVGRHGRCLGINDALVLAAYCTSACR